MRRGGQTDGAISIRSLHWSDRASSQSHFTTDDQSVSPSWYRALSGAHDQILITVWHLLFCRFRAPPLTRGPKDGVSIYCLLFLFCLIMELLITNIFILPSSLLFRRRIVVYIFRKLLYGNECISKCYVRHGLLWRNRRENKQEVLGRTNRLLPLIWQGPHRKWKHRQQGGLISLINLTRSAGKTNCLPSLDTTPTT
jgi:hypothetical protein